MYPDNKEILLIGLGNVLMQDEGVGVRAVEALECRYHLPQTVTVMDGGTTGTELLEPMRNVKHLIVADAVNTGDPLGTLVRIANEQVPAFFQTKLSNHQLGLSDLLGLLALTEQQPQTVTIVGLVPHGLENQLGLTAEGEAGVERMVTQLVRELADLGVTLTPKETPQIGYWARQAQMELAKCA
ncbi:HyaD/HybD family hydrogenase maturation endopeptidase [Magnetofaba australis]|uniref:Putative HybD peptidase n=1 Tax=Magnetofaba australis IT-1 TaxID=1434232 RepID=A0A1Y2K9E0_9PROT|nr:HyaD/HybD family hydrogenase maturation endopeptidase [Magnetofaba australis]OSM07296.1 putative HybD peptidase [Magnetofaba australis IT-1]